MLSKTLSQINYEHGPRFILPTFFIAFLSLFIPWDYVMLAEKNASHAHNFSVLLFPDYTF
jgi:hypothetical protein